MPERFGIRRGEVPPPVAARPITTWQEKVLAVGVTLLLAATAWIISNQLGIRGEQKAGRERGYVNRAQDCRILVALGVRLDTNDDCLIPEVRRHFDVDAAPTTGVHSEGQQINRELLCDIAASMGKVSRLCAASDE